MHVGDLSIKLRPQLVIPRNGRPQKAVLVGAELVLCHCRHNHLTETGATQKTLFMSRMSRLLLR